MALETVGDDLSFFSTATSRTHWKWTDADQIVSILRAVDEQVAGGVTVRDALAPYGVHVTTYFRWRRQYRGLSAAGIASKKATMARARRALRFVADIVTTDIAASRGARRAA